MCTCCSGLRQRLDGPSSCILPHDHLGDCQKANWKIFNEQDTMLAELQRPQPPAPPWFIPIIAELLPAKTAREMPRPGEIQITFDKSGRPTYGPGDFPLASFLAFMADIDKGQF